MGRGGTVALAIYGHRTGGGGSYDGGCNPGGDHSGRDDGRGGRGDRSGCCCCLCCIGREKTEAEDEKRNYLADNHV